MRENLIAIISGKAKASTKAIFSALLSILGLIQIPAVKNFISSTFATHPKVMTYLTIAISIGMLLHNPKVMAALESLGIEIPQNASVSVTQTTAVEVQSEKKEN